MYVATHLHTDMSNIRLKDSIITVEKAMDRAIEMGLKGIAFTDHACLSCHVDVELYTKQLIESEKLPKDFKVILGEEIYLTPNLEDKGKYYHFILLAKDLQGHELLRKISTKAWSNSYSYKNMDRVPIEIDDMLDIVKSNKGHIIGTTACLGGYLGKKVLEWREVKENGLDEVPVKTDMHIFISKCIDAFGEDFYFEVQPSDEEEQVYYNETLKMLSQAYNIPLIFATDAHYLKLEDRVFHKAFLNSQDGDREVDSFYKTAYMLSYDEIKEYLQTSFTIEEIENMRLRTIEIGNKCEHYSLFKPQQVPKCKFDLNSVRWFFNTGYEHIDRLLNIEYKEDNYWIRYCLQSLEDKSLWSPEYLERLNIEAEQLYLVSEKLNQRLSSYFILVQRMIQLAWKHSLVGVGRGSAVGWLSNYLMEITGVDPIKHKLDTWWRFLSIDRVELPDLDIDYNPLKKEEIMNEFKEEFGNVFNCATFGTCSSKSAIQSACRGLEIDNDIGMYISSMIPVERGALWTLDECFNGNDEKDRKPIIEFINEVAKYEGLKETALMFEGIRDKRSSHASAVYIFNDGIESCNAMMKTPSGLEITQFSMQNSDYMSALKMDVLWTEAQAKLQTCLELLIEKGAIEDKGSLKANYDEYLHPDKLEYLDRSMWEKAYNGEIVDLFQFSTAIGISSIKQTKPLNLYEATSTNCLMRLMGQEGKLTPLDKFTLFKSDISNWYKEMSDYNLQEHEVSLLKEYLEMEYGVCATQESMMKILMAIGFDMKQANYARKVVAKKKFRDIDNLKKLVYDVATEKGFSINIIDYVWDNVVMPSIGYSFSILHSLSYTIIAIQTMNIYTKFPSMYWNTACLIVNAGAEDGSTDYGKISVAIGDMKKNNVNVSLPNINYSDLLFNPDTSNNRILFGFKGISKINHEDADNIISNRPYTSLNDFYIKNKDLIQKSKIINLIKAGCFDELESKNRVEIMKDFIIVSCEDTKKKLTTTNIPLLIAHNEVPEEYDLEVSLYNFKKYLTNKSNLYKTQGTKKWYLVDPVVAQPFFEDNFLDDMLEDKDYSFNSNGQIIVSDKALDKHFKIKAVKLLDWLKSDDTLELANRLVYREDWIKYVKSTSIEKWEMETVSYYNDKHELEYVLEEPYGVVNYFDLPEIPTVIEEGVSKKGKPYKKFKIDSIIGTVIHKDANKHFVSLLTKYGVCNIKFSKGAFNFYNKQLSEVDTETGKKTVVDKSWFSRGTMLLIRGFRDGDVFRARAYGDLHTISLIEGIQDNGLLYLKMEREI